MDFLTHSLATLYRQRQLICVPRTVIGCSKPLKLLYSPIEVNIALMDDSSDYGEKRGVVGMDGYFTESEEDAARDAIDKSYVFRADSFEGALNHQGDEGTDSDGDEGDSNGEVIRKAKSFLKNFGEGAFCAKCVEPQYRLSHEHACIKCPGDNLLYRWEAERQENENVKGSSADTKFEQESILFSSGFGFSTCKLCDPIQERYNPVSNQCEPCNRARTGSGSRGDSGFVVKGVDDSNGICDASEQDGLGRSRHVFYMKTPPFNRVDCSPLLADPEAQQCKCPDDMWVKGGVDEDLEETGGLLPSKIECVPCPDDRILKNNQCSKCDDPYFIYNEESSQGESANGPLDGKCIRCPHPFLYKYGEARDTRGEGYNAREGSATCQCPLWMVSDTTKGIIKPPSMREGKSLFASGSLLGPINMLLNDRENESPEVMKAIAKQLRRNSSWSMDRVCVQCPKRMRLITGNPIVCIPCVNVNVLAAMMMAKTDLEFQNIKGFEKQSAWFVDYRTKTCSKCDAKYFGETTMSSLLDTGTSKESLLASEDDVLIVEDVDSGSQPEADGTINMQKDNEDSMRKAAVMRSSGRGSPALSGGKFITHLKIDVKQYRYQVVPTRKFAVGILPGSLRFFNNPKYRQQIRQVTTLVGDEGRCSRIGRWELFAQRHDKWLNPRQYLMGFGISPDFRDKYFRSPEDYPGGIPPIYPEDHPDGWLECGKYCVTKGDVRIVDMTTPQYQDDPTMRITKNLPDDNNEVWHPSNLAWETAKRECESLLMKLDCIYPLAPANGRVCKPPKTEASPCGTFATRDFKCAVCISDCNGFQLTRKNITVDNGSNESPNSNFQFWFQCDLMKDGVNVADINPIELQRLPESQLYLRDIPNRVHLKMDSVTLKNFTCNKLSILYDMFTQPELEDMLGSYSPPSLARFVHNTVFPKLASDEDLARIHLMLEVSTDSNFQHRDKIIATSRLHSLNEFTKDTSGTAKVGVIASDANGTPWKALPPVEYNVLRSTYLYTPDFPKKLTDETMVNITRGQAPQNLFVRLLAMDKNSIEYQLGKSIGCFHIKSSEYIYPPPLQSRMSRGETVLEMILVPGTTQCLDRSKRDTHSSAYSLDQMKEVKDSEERLHLYLERYLSLLKIEKFLDGNKDISPDDENDWKKQMKVRKKDTKKKMDELKKLILALGKEDINGEIVVERLLETFPEKFSGLNCTLQMAVNNAIEEHKSQ
eukprot:Nk52_evm23s1485 gene=Nk52_evmTU23s1485